MSNFFDTYLPYAKIVRDRIGQPISLTLSHWALETGYGKSWLANNSYNLGGIKYSTYSKTAKLETRNYSNMKYARYNSYNDFVEDYIRVMSLSYYDDVRKAYNTPGVEDDVKAMHESPYAEDTKQDIKLLKIIKDYGLTKYDNFKSDFTYPEVNNMDKEELKKYALIGAVMVGLLSLMD